MQLGKYAINWRTGILVSLTILTTCVLLSWSNAEQFPSATVVPSDTNHPDFATRDMSLVELRTEGAFGGADYVIPKAYLGGKQLWKGGSILPSSVPGDIRIEAALPDMRPWTFFGEELFEEMMHTHRQMLEDNILNFRSVYSKRFFKEWVTVHASYGHCFGLSKSQPAWLKKWGQPDTSYSNPLFEAKIDLGRPAGSLRSMYVPKQQGTYKLYIECPDWGGELRRCKAMSDYDEITGYEFLFSMTRLNEYQEIDMKVRGLLDKFVKESKLNEIMPAECKIH